MPHLHNGAGVSCCCELLSSPVGRRGLLLGVGALALPRFALAADGGKYEAMILGCIDPRLQTPVRNFAAKRGLVGKYSQFTIAGAAIGAVAPKFDDWHKAFWDNLAITVQLHDIKSVIAIDHRDCGAARVAYGDDCCSTPEKENETHKAALAEFRKEVGARKDEYKRELKVETYLMAIDGTYIPLG
ncbi:MAG TPA: carbonic anhydrase [Stellaceae bacterium]|nr:carbonic anhydrase [Stellaceae bacterium]